MGRLKAHIIVFGGFGFIVGAACLSERYDSNIFKHSMLVVAAVFMLYCISERIYEIYKPRGN